ncbi:sensor histidine kinase [Oryzobacter terrae]|uniref:sensor histidine kinase n=1 Tax=Oryzobacter terrae TaxID=1620385 RepID=UPI00366B1C8E
MTPDRGETARTDRVALTMAVATLALLLVDLWVVLVVEVRAPATSVVREFGFATAWLAVGCVALRVGRPRLARLILTLSLVLAANFVGSFGLYSDAVLPRLLVTVTAFLVPLQAPVGGHLLLAYPTGVLPEVAARRLVAFGYAVGGAESLWWGLTHTSVAACERCATSFSAVAVPGVVNRVATSTFSVVWTLAAVLFLVLLVRRYRRAGHRQRRLLLLPYASIAVLVVLFGLLSLVGAGAGTSAWALSLRTLVLLQVLGTVAVPLCFLVGLLHERLSYRRIGELVVELAGSPDTDLQRSLSLALGDPHLRVVYPVGDGFVDGSGRAAPPPVADERSVVTPVGDAGADLALIRHDRSLSEEPALLTAAGSATRIILENARLAAEVRSQLLEVRESRARIVTATDEARARLERDLHDGAQQRLLAIGIALRLLRQRPGDPTLLDAAEEELVSALAEVRDLASGIHPAVLTDHGLGPALEALTHRLGRGVVLRQPAGPVGRLASPVEAAAYFAAAEAVSNALKHAAPSTVTLTLERRGDVLALAVEDDGGGGADADGAGLVGVRDRLAAVDGTLRLSTQPGEGTTLTMEIPCG